MEADIELRQLRYFKIVAEELNFTRAAERLQMAQPPLSRQIQKLEQSLQVQLFERTNRKVSLTPAGEVFLKECEQILQTIDQSIRVTKRAALGEIGQLTIAFEGSFHNETLLNVIQQFRHQSPDVELILQEMTSGQQMEALHQKLIDVGFADPIFSGDNIDFIKLAEEPLVAVLPKSHPLCEQQSIDLTQLSTEPWITGQNGKGCGLLTRILQACKECGFQPHVQQETNDVQMIIGFVASGLGITLLPASTNISGNDSVISRSLNSPLSQIELAIAWEPDNSSAVLRAFIDIVQSVFAPKLIS